MVLNELTTIGFDADDTLWQNERFFRMTEERFVRLLSEYAEGEDLVSRLLETERRNLARYGFGIKGFTLSMIETAVEVSNGRLPAGVVGEILAAGREMLSHPIEPLPHAAEVLGALSGSYRIILVTKGDLFDQERKLAQSGLGGFFDAVEIVSDKTAETYARIFARHGEGAARSMMVGNSLRSDVLPAIEAGSWGVHVPHELTWAVEHAETPHEARRFRRIDHLGQLQELLAAILG